MGLNGIDFGAVESTPQVQPVKPGYVVSNPAAVSKASPNYVGPDKGTSGGASAAGSPSGSGGFSQLFTDSDARNSAIGAALGAALIGLSGAGRKRDPDDDSTPIGDAVRGLIIGGLAGYAIPKGIKLIGDSMSAGSGTSKTAAAAAPAPQWREEYDRVIRNSKVKHFLGGAEPGITGYSDLESDPTGSSSIADKLPAVGLGGAALVDSVALGNAWLRYSTSGAKASGQTFPAYLRTMEANKDLWWINPLKPLVIKDKSCSGGRGGRGGGGSSGRLHSSGVFGSPVTKGLGVLGAGLSLGVALKSMLGPSAVKSKNEKLDPWFGNVSGYMDRSKINAAPVDENGNRIMFSGPTPAAQPTP